MSQQQFERWTVLQAEGRHWLCRCACGVERSVDKYSLASGSSASCGCFRAEQLSARRVTHGKSKTPEYRVWAAMLDRCHRPEARDYSSYGARGIRVCVRWRKFENFLADMGPRPEGKRHTVERRKNDKGYSPSNCYWATYVEQARNRRSTLRIGGVPLISAAEAKGLKAATVRSRLARGKPDAELLLAGSKEMRRAQAKREGAGLLAKVAGKVVALKELAETTGIPYNTLKYRLKHGRPLTGNAKSRKEPATA